LRLTTIKNNNTVTFSVDRNSMKTALDAFDQIQKKAKGKDPTINMKRFSQGLKSAERELDKLNKKASVVATMNERRAAKAQARVEAQAAKEAARNAQRREREGLNCFGLPAALNQCNTLPMLSLQGACSVSRITKVMQMERSAYNARTARLSAYSRVASRREAAKRGATAPAGGSGAITGG
jgi:uncharacterized FlgJ-related protein